MDAGIGAHPRRSIERSSLVAPPVRWDDGVTVTRRSAGTGAARVRQVTGESKVPGSVVVRVPRAGHSVYFEQPDVFNFQVLRFIRQIQAREEHI